MNRSRFLQSLGLIGMGTLMERLWGSGIPGHGISPNMLKSLASLLPATDRMPVLFLGHGSPMNAIADNVFVEGFRDMATRLHITPEAVLCVSAHWETRGTKVTAMAQPRTIHDFGGFPQALFDVQYPAPGFPEFAEALSQEEEWKAHLELDHQWGLDHGTWSVIKHLYPEADIPVLQLSLNQNLTPAEHLELGGQLRRLRDHGVLIVGSGNMVHNLGLVDWQRMNEVGHGFEWARDAAQRMEGWILDGDHRALAAAATTPDRALRLSVPTPEHYLPLLYALGATDPTEPRFLFNDHMLAGSLSMTSVAIGLEPY